MRILVIWLQGPRDHAIAPYGFWRGHWKGALEEAGHECLEVPGVNWAKGLGGLAQDALSAWRTDAWERTVEYLRGAGRVDLCLSYLFPRQIERAAIRRIRETGVPCVNFFCDNLREYRAVPDAFRDFDLHFGPEPQAASMYGAAGLKFAFAPYPVWLPPGQRTAQHAERHGVTFIGSRDVQRAHLLARALGLGLPVEIRGAGWTGEPAAARAGAGPAHGARERLRRQAQLVHEQGPLALLWKLTYLLRDSPGADVFARHVQPAPDAAAYVSILQQSTVALGVNRVPSYRRPFWSPLTAIRLRDLEAPAMGACYLTEYSAGLEHWFELGRDIEVYRDAQEMVDKARALGADAQRRGSMRQRAQKRVFGELAFGRSVERLAGLLGARR